MHECRDFPDEVEEIRRPDSVRVSTQFHDFDNDESLLRWTRASHRRRKPNRRF
jgi:hypothetical protein